MATPSEILRKTKKSAEPSEKMKYDKDGANEQDEKIATKHGESKPNAGVKRNALIDFIAKNKKRAA